jgi:hypothetical protein
MSSAGANRIVFALVLAGSAGCGRSADPVVSAEPCRTVVGSEDGRWKPCDADTPCGDHFACTPVAGRKDLTCCMFADRKCGTEANCCPGQTCPEDRKKCFDKFLECKTDADCGSRGDRFCEKWTDSYGTSGRCRLRACGPSGECPPEQSCFQGECVAALPCGGRCDPGKACVPAIDRCQSFACPASCAPGFIATFADNRRIWDTCSLPDVACTCAELPPLRSSDLGRFSAIAVDAAHGAIFVSQYDGEYGDLVVDRFGADGKLEARQYVDGVPAGAPVKYGPSGPRGGVIDPGPDVGRHTDAAAAGGHLYVSYHDATNGDLKLAIRAPDGAWKRVRVDGATADVGLYTSVAVDAAGLPIISYFQRAGGEGFDPSSCPGVAPGGDPRLITALKVARARKQNPDAADFTLVTAACHSRTPRICEGCQQTCADPGSGPGCYAASTSCSGCNPLSQACVIVAGAPVCAAKSGAPSLAEIPDGIGLFSAIATRGSDAYVLYMRRVGGRGELHGVRLGPGAQVGAPVVLDASGDTGYFPAVAVDPSSGALAMAWHDFSSHDLKFLSLPELAAGAEPTTIDSGRGRAGSGETRWVGADVALAYSPSGALFATYQDSSRGDLKLAIRAAGWQALPPVRTEGAVGFFADAAFLGNTLFLSHARIRARLLWGVPKVDNALLLDRFIAPSP